MPTLFLLMMLGQIAVVVVAAAAFYFLSSNSGTKARDSSSTPEKGDAKRVADLFAEVGNVLAFHGRALLKANREADGDDDASLRQAADLATLRHCNRETNRSLQQRNAELGDVMQHYGGLYRSERDRLDAYAAKTEELNRAIGSSSHQAEESHGALLQLVEEMREENDRLRSKVADAQGQAAELIAQAARSDRDARLDALTQLPNRRAWDEHLQSKMPDDVKYIAVVDIDRFKLINDHHGHPAGDAVLTLLGTLFGDLPNSLPFRIGGDEFGLILSGVAPGRAQQILEHIRGKVQRSTLHFQAQTLGVTVSLGVAATEDNRSLEATVVKADQALYAAKQAGGNRVHFSVAAPEPDSPAADNSATAAP